MTTDPRRIAHSLILSASGGLMALATVFVCATTDPAAAPKGASLAIILGGAILPAACAIAAEVERTAIS